VKKKNLKIIGFKDMRNFFLLSEIYDFLIGLGIIELELRLLWVFVLKRSIIGL